MNQSERIAALKKKTVDADPNKSWIQPYTTFMDMLNNAFRGIYDGVFITEASGGHTTRLTVNLRDNIGRIVFASNVFDFPGNCGTALFVSLSTMVIKTEEDKEEINCILDTIQSSLSRMLALYCCPINGGYEAKEEFLGQFGFAKTKESGFLNINSNRTNYTFARVINSKKR